VFKGWYWMTTFTGAVVLPVLALPLAALVVWALAHRRSRAGIPSAWRRSLADVGLVHGTVPCVWMVLMPGEHAGEVTGRVSLVPFADLASMPALGIAGNMLVFASVGFFAPLRFAALASVPRIVAFAAGCSALLEIAQFVLRLDRVSSVDDVLLNAAGAGIAALASRYWWRTKAVAVDRFRPIPVAGA
jgi:hypothetical protein